MSNVLIELQCPECGAPFTRYPAQIHSERPFCSRECYGRALKTRNLGEANPNYRTGIQTGTKYCGCGRVRDWRAKRCVYCRNTHLDERIDEAYQAIQQTDSFNRAAKLMGVSRQAFTRWYYRQDDPPSIDHFKPARSRASGDDLFTRSKVRRNAVLRTHIRRRNLIPYICSECGQDEAWNDRELVLELHHVDGDSCNNSLDNLVFLCPNCHSQTNSWRGKAAAGTPKKRQNLT